MFKSRLVAFCCKDLKLFVAIVSNWKHVGVASVCRVYSQSMAAVNRHKKEAGYPGTIPERHNDVEKDDAGFTTPCNDLMEDNSTPIIIIFELFKQTEFHVAC